MKKLIIPLLLIIFSSAAFAQVEGNADLIGWAYNATGSSGLVNITYDYTSLVSQVNDENNLDLFYWDASTTTWKSLDAELDTNADTLTVEQDTSNFPKIFVLGEKNGTLEGEILTVCKSGACDYTSIKTALNESVNGSIIEIQDSLTYDEGALIVNKSNLTLRAASGQTPKITGAGTAAQIITIDANDVLLDGLEIFNGTGDLVKQSSSHSGTIVQNSVLHDSTGDECIQLKYCTDCLIQDNLAYNCDQDGIGVSYSTNSKVLNNEIYNSDSENGIIYLYGNTNTEIANNYIHDSTGANGILMYKPYGANHVIKNNTFVNNNFTNTWKRSWHGNGISLYKIKPAASVLVEDNTIDDNSGNYNNETRGHAVGYVCAYTDEGTFTIQDNVLTDNSGYGVYVDTVYDCTSNVPEGDINSNTLSNNGLGNFSFSPGTYPNITIS